MTGSFKKYLLKIFNLLLKLFFYVERIFFYKEEYGKTPLLNPKSRYKYQILFNHMNTVYRKLSNVKEKEELCFDNSIGISPYIMLLGNETKKDYTELVNQFAGPKGDFYKQKLKWIDIFSEDLTISYMTIDGENEDNVPVDSYIHENNLKDK